MSEQKACEQCPWRTANQGKKHFGHFYTKQNLTRLWNQIRKGGGRQSCHLTDPSHPDHVISGASAHATAKECPGSVILVHRELELIANGKTNIDVPEINRYLSTRKKGLSKQGILYWLVSRYQLGGTPLIGGQKLPPVNKDDKEIDLPEYLKDVAK